MSRGMRFALEAAFIVAAAVVLDAATPVPQWLGYLLTMAVAVVVVLAMLAVRWHHRHRCLACGRIGEHFDPRCTDPADTLCPACGGES